MKSYKYIIIGGGIAGDSAATSIRQSDQDGNILIISAEQFRPYQKPPLSKYYLIEGEGLEERVLLKSQDYYDEKDIDLVLGKRCTRIDRDKNQVETEDNRTFSYKKLLLATGGRAVELPIPGHDLDNVFTLRSINDSQAIREAALGAKHALILGGSFIGSEVAAAIRQLGPQVTMVFPEKRLLQNIVPRTLSDYLQDMYSEKGVQIRNHTKPEKLIGNHKLEAVQLDDGESLDVDMAVMGVGIKLNTEIARDCSLEMNDEGALIVNQYLQTSDPDIYAAGDIAACPDEIINKRIRLEHWDVARKQGQLAGKNMAGKATPYHELPHFFSDLFDFSYNIWGYLSMWDQTVLRGNLQDKNFAYFYFCQDYLVGVLSKGYSLDEQKSMQALIKHRKKYDEIIEVIEDTEQELSKLLPKEERDMNHAKEKPQKALSFAKHIRPMFRKKDIEEMIDISNFDLSKYEDVKERAELVLERLKDGSMPCDGAWSEEKIATYEKWIKDGKQA